MSFLPEGYVEPKSNSKYLKLEQGENRIRILSKPIIGWEDWKDKKPYRYRESNKPEKSLDPTKPFKHFWSFVVWNYKSQAIEIFHVTQATIRTKIGNLSKDQDWGSPFYYDIKITKEGNDKETKYEVSPSPKRELSVEIKESFDKTPIDLDEMFRNGDPFAAAGGYRTKAFWEEEPETVVNTPTKEYIARTQVDAIEALIREHIERKAPSWRSDALKALKVPNFEQLEKKYYDLVLKRISEKRAAIIAEETKEMEEIPF